MGVLRKILEHRGYFERFFNILKVHTFPDRISCTKILFSFRCGKYNAVAVFKRSFRISFEEIQVEYFKEIRIYKSGFQLFIAGILVLYLRIVDHTQSRSIFHLRKICLKRFGHRRSNHGFFEFFSVYISAKHDTRYTICIIKRLLVAQLVPNVKRDH